MALNFLAKRDTTERAVLITTRLLTLERLPTSVPVDRLATGWGADMLNQIQGFRSMGVAFTLTRGPMTVLIS